MSGHSKWSTIKRAKGVNDVKRGQLFTKLAREIVIASREGGADAEMNVRLRLAIQKAKDNNMPGDNIERAINRGSGDSGADALQEVIYEGYGPGGAAILLEALTDNTTRTVSEVRNAFSKGGGNMGQPGCVAWNFEIMGVVVLEASGNKAEELTLLAIDAGAEDFEEEQETLEVRMSVPSFERVRKALEDANARYTEFLKNTFPEVGLCTPVITFIKVDFPAPLSPINATTSPLFILIFTSFRTFTFPKFL